MIIWHQDHTEDQEVQEVEDLVEDLEVITEDGQVTEIDCAYPGCIHRSVCPIAKQVDELAE